MYLNVAANDAKINVLIESAALISLMMVKKRQGISRRAQICAAENSKVYESTMTPSPCYLNN